jgi:hypothetical protein
MTGFEPAAFWSRTRRAQLFYWGSLSPNLRVSSEYRTISSSKYRLDAPRSWVFTIHSLIQPIGKPDLCAYCPDRSSFDQSGGYNANYSTSNRPSFHSQAIHQQFSEYQLAVHTPGHHILFRRSMGILSSGYTLGSGYYHNCGQQLFLNLDVQKPAP